MIFILILFNNIFNLIIKHHILLYFLLIISIFLNKQILKFIICTILPLVFFWNFKYSFNLVLVYWIF